jgi:hypothetical protein
MANSRICSVQDCGKPHYCKGFCNAHYRRMVRNGDPLKGETSPGTLRKYVDEVAIPFAGKECLSWPFSTDKDGYGQIKVGGKNRKVHRYICELVHGEPPTLTHHTAHSCGNGHLGCINPNHLSWKTPQGNMDDMVAHGTSTRGEKHPNVKITENDARYILAAKGIISQKSLDAQFDISQAAVSRIQRRVHWVHL